MDALYFFRHSSFDDIELRYSLRSVAKHMPWIRKVWIFGDRPAFLSDDVALVEHVPHEYVARIGKYRTPVTNFFLMFHLSSLIPDLTSEFVFFSDDFICLSDVSVEQAVLTRCIDDMSVSHWQPRGIWQTTLRRTHELLQRLGYPTYNFETHCPTYFRRKWIFDAWCDFRDFVTEDRWYGPTGPTAILNHACLHEKFALVFREEEGLWIGFHGREPSETDIAIGTQNRKFLNFDDDAFGPAIQRYLEGKFPDSCRYEKVDPDMPLRGATGRVSDKSCQDFAVQRYPAPILSDRRRIAPLLNERGLTDRSALVGIGDGKFSESFLKKWRGKELYCISPPAPIRSQKCSMSDGGADAGDEFSPSAALQMLQEAKRRLMSFASRCHFFELNALEAACRFSPGTLDFVYIEAIATRDSLHDILDAWWSRLSTGGIMAGNNYLDGDLPSGVYKVKSTVDTWAASHGLDVSCTGEPVYRSWIIQAQE